MIIDFLTNKQIKINEALDNEEKLKQAIYNSMLNVNLCITNKFKETDFYTKLTRRLEYWGTTCLHLPDFHYKAWYLFVDARGSGKGKPQYNQLHLPIITFKDVMLSLSTSNACWSPCALCDHPSLSKTFVSSTALPPDKLCSWGISYDGMFFNSGATTFSVNLDPYLNVLSKHLANDDDYYYLETCKEVNSILTDIFLKNLDFDSFYQNILETIDNVFLEVSDE